MSNKVHFSPVEVSEQKSRLWQLDQKKGSITLWSKGSKSRFEGKVTSINSERTELIVEIDESLEKNKVTYGFFDLNGISYFFKCKYKLLPTKELKLFIHNEDFFKTERRKNFRLLAYPNYNIFAHFYLEEGYQGANVVELKSKSSQTSLFKTFLKLVENKTDETNPGLEKEVKLRVQDLSVTGLSLHVGEVELELFPKNALWKEVKLDIQGHEITIPKARVVYSVDMLNKQKGLKRFKVGIKFEEVDTNLDTELASVINKLLRDVDYNKEFEDFLK